VSYLPGVETTVDIAAYEALKAENQALREQLAQLGHELAQLKRLIFGTKRERFVPAGLPEQLPLFAGTALPREAVEALTLPAGAPPLSFETVTY